MTVIANQGGDDNGELEPLPRLFQRNFSPARLAERRAAVASAIGPGHVAVVAGAALPGGMVLFRQTNEMYYLTGVEVPHAYLLIDGDTGASTLYLAHLDAGHARSSGDYLNADDVEVAAAPDRLRTGRAGRTARPRPRPLRAPAGAATAAHAGRPRRGPGLEPRLAARRDRRRGRRPVVVDVDRRVAVRPADPRRVPVARGRRPHADPRSPPRGQGRRRDRACSGAPAR